MASSVSLYSSSPPSAISFGGRREEGHTSRQKTAPHQGTPSGRGGLSSLLGSVGSGKWVVGSADNVDAGVSTSGSSMYHVMDVAYTREFVGSIGVAIPATSGLRHKDRSPATVLYGFGSSTKSSASPSGLVAREGSGGHTRAVEQIQSWKRMSIQSERPLATAERSGAEARRPALQRVGFVVRKCEETAAPSFRLGDDGDMEFSNAILTRDQFARAESREGPFIDYCHPMTAPEDVSSQTEKQEIEKAREKLGRIMDQSVPDGIASSPPIWRDMSPSQCAERDQELLLSAQKSHAMFYDPLVRKAFSVAATAHQGQFRKSGDPYVVHCLETGMILAKAGLDKTVVAAGMLHDTLDDSMMTEQQLRDIFGDKLANLVGGVSKLSQLSQLTRDSHTCVSQQEAERLRSIFMSMTNVSVVLIKLADRLHNLRTLSALPHIKQQRVAKESLDVFAPLVNRLGIWSWKAEIEDLCFKYLHPEEHSELACNLGSGSSSAVVMTAVQRVDAGLKDAGVLFHDLNGRPKNLYSIYSKMKKKGRKLNEIHDQRGLRIIVEDEESCYEALAVVHTLWRSAGTEHTKDYIATPKPNGYRSLHTVVHVEEGVSVEVQIRTREMHYQAEYGLAAHWRYKEGDAEYSASLQNMYDYQRWVLTFQAEVVDTKCRVTPATGIMQAPCPFPTHLNTCCYSEEHGEGSAALAGSDCDPVYIVLFENEGIRVTEVPGGSTAGDMLKRKVGAKEIGVNQRVRPLVNHQLVEDLDQRLKMGDLVELAAEPVSLREGFDFNDSQSRLLPLHALAEVDEWADVSFDEVAVELERERLNQTWARRLRDGKENMRLRHGVER